jgi:hypothetical protein
VTSLSESSQGEVGDNREKCYLGIFFLPETRIYITQIGVITICVVLDHNTVMFQKEKGGGGPL